MRPEELAQDPAVRAAVFASVTQEEARRILGSRAGKPWCDAWVLEWTGSLPVPVEIRDDLVAAVRQVQAAPEHAPGYQMCDACGDERTEHPGDGECQHTDILFGETAECWCGGYVSA